MHKHFSPRPFGEGVEREGLLSMSVAQVWSSLVLDYQNSVNLPVVVGSVTLFITYWSFGLIHLFLDITRMPHALYHHKIQKTAHFIWNAQRSTENPPGRRLFANLLLSMFFIVPFTLWAMDRGTLRIG
jgi:hypothetical protein